MGISNADENTAPTMPELVSPSNWQTEVDLNVSFDWTDSDDLEDDNFTYTLKVMYIAPDGTSVTLLRPNLTTSEYTTFDLDLWSGNQHQWCVQAVQTDNNATLGYTPVWNFQTSGDKYGELGISTRYKVLMNNVYNIQSNSIETYMWLEFNNIKLDTVSDGNISIWDINGNLIGQSTDGIFISDGIYYDTYTASSMKGLYTLRGTLTYNGEIYYGMSTFDASIVEKDTKIDTITTTTSSTYISIQAVKAVTDTIDWSDIEEIMTDVSVIDWSDIDYIYTTSGEIKAKTDTIAWADISNIKLKTDTILWTDITSIKSKTDTINWSDITAIKTNTDTINWEDIEEIYTYSGEIKLRTDDIDWDDILAIKTKTSTINWKDVTAIKKKTDNILWSDVTFIKTKVTPINWNDITTIKEKVNSSWFQRIVESISYTFSMIKYTINGNSNNSNIGNIFDDVLNGIGRFFGNLPSLIGLT